MTTEYAETMKGLLVECLQLRDRLSATPDYFELLDQLNAIKDRAVRSYKRRPTPEGLEDARKAMLAIAMLCDLKGNNIGYQHVRFGELKALEAWRPKARTPKARPSSRTSG